MARQEGTVLEERYMRVSREGGKRVLEPPPRQAHRDQRPKKRSAVKSAFWGLYKFLFCISALIVAVYIGARLMVRPPEQAPTVWELIR